ncbi:MAG: hypothetical protein Q8M94_20710 [Ignavibacteria bacterium]|nr:hypothetical protein [Ignavibacteria bacterium]
MVNVKWLPARCGGMEDGKITNSRYAKKPIRHGGLFNQDYVRKTISQSDAYGKGFLTLA